MKKLLILNCFCFRDMSRNMDNVKYVITLSNIKIDSQIICHFLQFKEFFPTVHATLSNGACHSSQTAANKKLEQENKHFSQKNRIFETLARYWGQKTLIIS